MGQNPDVTIRIQRIERKLYPNITILSIHSHRFSLLYLNMDKPLRIQHQENSPTFVELRDSK